MIIIFEKDFNMSDLNMITGTSSQARAQSDRQTATQSKIIDVREQLRESCVLDRLGDDGRVIPAG